MNGNSWLIDTNIALYLLKGDETIAKMLDGRTIYTSFITELELLGYPEIQRKDIPVLEEFLNDCIIVELNQPIKKLTIELKRNYKIKLPDAIIAATSMYINIPLISADKGFDRINELQFLQYEL